MNITLRPTVLDGTIRAIPSKSHAHRLLICASLADNPTEIICPQTSRDIEATAACLRAIGARIERTEDGYRVTPISRISREDRAILECGESGSTLRFLLPICAALGGEYQFNMQGRLPVRPLSPLYEILAQSGAHISETGRSPLYLDGRFAASHVEIAADVSSQYISGLLFCAPLLDVDSFTLTLTTEPESSGYIDMTIDCMREFGVTVECGRNIAGRVEYTVRGSYVTPARVISAEGDWSNAAFWLCAGAIGSGCVSVSGLSSRSLQPDRAIVDILRDLGADVRVSGDTYTVYPARLEGRRINIRETPDLAPVICVVAACAETPTEIVGGERLRIKESDRIASSCAMICALGGSAEEREDGMIIHPTGLSGGVVDSANDHRIAMAAAVGACASAGDISILGAEATEKSYPAFFADFESLCKI